MEHVLQEHTRIRRIICYICRLLNFKLRGLTLTVTSLIFGTFPLLYQGVAFLIKQLPHVAFVYILCSVTPLSIINKFNGDRIFSKKGSSGFSASSTAEEVTQGIDGAGLTAIVTGATSGIGLETSRILALRGVHVVMAIRNMNAGNNVKESILKEIPNARVDVMELDLSSLASVRKFAAEYDSKGFPLNILVNNAGVMADTYKLSQDNIELNFATNHLGHFLLTNLLLETMKRTTRESNREGRIVNLSSMCHQYSSREGIRFDSINDKSRYKKYMAYIESKLANILHANELTRRLKEERFEITANSLHPGTIRTNIIGNHIFVECFLKVLGLIFMTKTIQQGAATTCFLALHPQVKGVSGEYFVDCNIAKPSSRAKDADLAKRLWDFSLSLTNNLKE